MEYFRLIVEIVAGIIVLGGAAWKIGKVIKLFAEGQKCLLRSQMLDTYYKCRKDQEITQWEMEAFLKSFLSYKALGGNSFITQVCEEVKAFRITERK